MRLIEDAPVGGASNEVEHQVLPLGRSVRENRAAVDGPQGGDALAPGMKLPKPYKNRNIAVLKDPDGGAVRQNAFWRLHKLRVYRL